MSERWNELIERVLSGQLDLQSPEIREASQEEGFVKALDETLAVMGDLDERSVLEEAVELRDVPGEERAFSLVVEDLAPPRAGVLRQLLVVAAAIAATVLLIVFFRSGATPPEVAPIPLGTEGIVCDAPRGAGADFAVFRWSVEADGGAFEVEVYDTVGELLAGGTSGRLTGAREWRPAPEAAKGWPDRIEWLVRWVRPGGSGTETAFGTASR